MATTTRKTVTKKSTENPQAVEKVEKAPIFIANGTIKLGEVTYFAGQVVPATREQLAHELAICLVYEVQP